VFAYVCGSLLRLVQQAGCTWVSMAALILEALLARQQEHDATVTRLKAEGVTGDVRAAAQDELRNVKAQILLVLQAQYDGAAGDFAAQDELAPRLRAYMNKDQQKVFDRRRKHDRAAAAKGVDGGGEEQTAENDFAKNNTKKCKKEGDAVNAEDTRGACSAHAAKCTEAAGSVGLAVHFSHAERAVLPLVSFLAATLTDSPTVFEAVLKEADAQPRLQTPTGDVVVVGDVAIAKYLGGQTLTPAAHLVDIERLVELSVTLGTSERSLAQALSGLNLHLETRTYVMRLFIVANIRAATRFHTCRGLHMRVAGTLREVLSRWPMLPCLWRSSTAALARLQASYRHLLLMLSAGIRSFAARTKRLRLCSRRCVCRNVLKLHACVRTCAGVMVSFFFPFCLAPRSVMRYLQTGLGQACQHCQACTSQGRAQRQERQLPGAGRCRHGRGRYAFPTRAQRLFAHWSRQGT